MVAPEEMTMEAEPGSNAHAVAVMEAQFPGSWLPYGSEQVERNAAPYFRLVTKGSGRLDYIETIRQWRKRFAEPSLKKSLLKLSLVPRYLVSRNFRRAFASGISANTICFERQILDHSRMVFEKED